MSPSSRLGYLIQSDIAAWADLWLPRLERRGLRYHLAAARLLWLMPGLRAAAIYRLSQVLHHHRMSFVPQLLSQVNLMLHGLDIPASVPIGPGLYIPHPVGTVIMAQRVGSRATLVSNVTIGMRHEPAFPVIGDDVYIGAGARVLGSITIGSNVTIGANAVVIHDVPDHSVAVGVPARVRPYGARSGANDGGIEAVKGAD